jgi:hypothetical protein
MAKGKVAIAVAAAIGEEFIKEALDTLFNKIV